MGARRQRSLLLALLSSVLVVSALAAAQRYEVKTSFRVKYINGGALYLDGGRNAGLTRDIRLTVKRPDTETPGGYQVIAEIQVVDVGSASAVCEIRSLTSPTVTAQVGDIAFLSEQDIQALQVEQGGLGSQRYPQVVTFTESDPLDEEQRAYVPRPPLPEINRARGRIGFDYNILQTRGNSLPSSSQLGMVLRADITRIGGTYWNFTGYWRGRLNSGPGGTQQQTLTTLINRTYQLGFTYVNPQSRWVAGAGRLYLPWAVSLSTIDGGYFGRRLGANVIVGMFGGSTPDPSAWNYNANRQLGGTFLNFERGTFESVRFSSTFGVGLTRIHWKREREFAFTETGIFYKRFLSIYHSLQADMLPPDAISTTSGGTSTTTPVTGNRSPGLTQSFLTVRIQPHPRISFDVTDNYFRNSPTFDPRLVGTGLVEKYLFEGISGGVRVELPYGLGAYTTIGRSSTNNDTRPSLNQLYGIFLNNMWHTGIRMDAHYSKFDSSFGRGSFEAFSLSRQFREKFRWEIQGGQQDFVSMLTQQNRSRWITSNVEWYAGRHYFLEVGLTIYRGGTLPYNQVFFSSGYRF
jgi:hypothetical protein